MNLVAARAPCHVCDKVIGYAAMAPEAVAPKPEGPASADRTKALGRKRR